MQDKQNKIIELTKKLILFKSMEEYPQEKDRCFDFIVDYFKDSIFSVKRIKNKFCNAVIISNTKSKIPDLMLNGHIDVVNGNDDQFKSVVVDGKIYGRGAIDMKASVAVMMMLMKRITSKEIKIKTSLMLVGDEEIPQGRSTEYLIKKYNYRPKFTIIGEETNFGLVVRQKGSLNLELEYKGKSGHSAFPSKGVNAIDNLINAYNELKKLAVFQKRKNFFSTINLSEISGGQCINQIPDKSVMKINIRYIDNSDLNQILKKIKFLISRDRRLKIRTYPGNSVMKSINCEKELMCLKSSIYAITKRKGKEKFSSTGSDAKYFYQSNLSVVVFGPQGKNYHRENEYVDIQSLINYYDILDNYLINKQKNYARRKRN